MQAYAGTYNVYECPSIVYMYSIYWTYSIFCIYCNYTVAKVEMAPRCVMSKNLCHWPTLPSLNIDHPKDDRDVNDDKDQEEKSLFLDLCYALERCNFSTSRLTSSHNDARQMLCGTDQTNVKDVTHETKFVDLMYDV